MNVNPLQILAGVIALVMAWALIGQIRAGEFRLRSGGNIKSVKRADNPQVFWILAAVFAASIIYIGSFVFTAG